MFHMKLQEAVVLPVLIVLTTITLRYLVKHARNGSPTSIACLTMLFIILLVWSIFYGITLYFYDVNYMPS